MIETFIQTDKEDGRLRELKSLKGELQARLDPGTRMVLTGSCASLPFESVFLPGDFTPKQRCPPGSVSVCLLVADGVGGCHAVIAK